MTKTDKFFIALIYTALVVVLTASVVRINAKKEYNETVKQFLIQQGRYEKCLDSTAQYISDKYGEFLPDTYWSGDIYQNIYIDSEDKECWQ